MARNTYPKCDHRDSQVIVTNQPKGIDPFRSLRSTWVCSRSECVWDAAAWVLRGTGEKPWWRVGTTGEWSDEKYVEATERDGGAE